MKCFAVLLILLSAALLVGCPGQYEVAPIPPAARETETAGPGQAAPVLPTGMPASDTPSAQPASAEPVAAETPQPAGGLGTPAVTAPQPSPSAGPAIKLSAGVALPQSLPTGTAMGFSVDYRFTQGGPGTVSRCVWVIEASRADQPVRQDVQLQTEGTLQMFVPQWRPEHGPFRCHIESASGQQLSDSMPLR